MVGEGVCAHTHVHIHVCGMCAYLQRLEVNHDVILQDDQLGFFSQCSNNLFPRIVLFFENFIPIYNVFGHIHLPIPPSAYPPSNSMSSSFYFYSPLSLVRASYTCIDMGASMGVWAINGHTHKERWLFLLQKTAKSLSQQGVSASWISVGPD